MDDRSVTVPVIVDSVKQIERFNRSRCVYFRAEYDDVAAAAPRAGVRKGMLPLWDQGALLVKPLRGDRFRNVGMIERLFKRCEDNDMLVTQGHVWVPNRLLHKDPGKILRGAVYRLPYNLFLECERLGSEERLEDGVNSSRKKERPELCPDETESFRKWGQKQIRAAKKQYHSPDAESWRLRRKGGAA